MYFVRCFIGAVVINHFTNFHVVGLNPSNTCNYRMFPIHLIHVIIAYFSWQLPISSCDVWLLMIIKCNLIANFLFIGIIIASQSNYLYFCSNVVKSTYLNLLLVVGVCRHISSNIGNTCINTRLL